MKYLAHTKDNRCIRKLRCSVPIVSVLILAPLASADTLRITTNQITSSSAQETIPTIGNDGTSDLVVYTSRASSISPGEIFYQRLNGDGSPNGTAVQVTNASTDDELNDISGDHIVYTAYPSTTDPSGTIMVYRISTGTLLPLGSAPYIFEPRIFDDAVVWREATSSGDTLIKLYHLAWLGTTQQAVTIAGPIPPTFDVEIGDRFVVWSERTNGQWDLFAYDLALGIRYVVASSANINERQATTSGAWIVWQERETNATSARIEALNLDTGESRVIVDDGALSRLPTVNGDLVTYESNASGNFDVSVHRLSTNETFAVTNAPGEQLLNDIFGSLVAWVDSTSGNDDIFVANLTFNTAPVADAGPDQAISLLNSTVALDGSASYDLEADPLTYSWALIQKPVASAAILSNANSPTPTFIADVQGSYQAELVVTDGWAQSAPDTVAVSFDNVAPVANAGGNQAVYVHETVVLDGSASSDTNGDPLTYRWSLVTVPAGSTAILNDVTSTQAGLVADVAGTYVVSLAVNDGLIDSAPDTANITAVTAQTAAQAQLINAVSVINGLDPAGFKNGNLVNALTNKINAVLGLIDQGLYQEALDKLENDVLGKTDGCPQTGAPDPNDWITTCPDQAQVYPLIIDAIAVLSTLI